MNSATCLLVALSVFAVFGSNSAAQGKTFVGRLSVVPITQAMLATVTGQGTVTAVLTGENLSVTGTFQGLKSPATIAQLHVGVRGVRGPSVADLMVSGGTSGTIKGVIALNRELRQALDKNSLYIQLHSEKAPEGNLWGWLLPQEVKP